MCAYGRKRHGKKKRVRVRIIKTNVEKEDKQKALPPILQLRYTKKKTLSHINSILIVYFLEFYMNYWNSINSCVCGAL